MVFLGFFTIHEGQRALIRDVRGNARVVDGPARLTLHRSTVDLLTRVIAGQDEYLEVQNVDGEKRVVPGPCAMFENPIEHKYIRCHSAEFVNGGEALVIYKAERCQNSGGEGSVKRLQEDTNSSSVTRIIKYGPARYVPHPNEWLHHFKWHGADPANKTRKVYGVLQFHKLRVLADQTYYNVGEVRTKDDTLLTVKLMIFFELKDVEKMLDNTHDPIGDFINAVASDVVAFCATLTYDQFLEKTSSLNQKVSFPQLCSRAEGIGYQINKVVFRGFHSSDALQAMHDKSIQERTRLRLQTDTEEQSQRLMDLKLRKEDERASLKRQLESESSEHKRDLTRKDHLQQLLGDQEKRDAILLHMTKSNEAEAERLRTLKDLGVDLTSVLVAEQRAADKHLRIDSAPARNPIRMHFHDI